MPFSAGTAPPGQVLPALSCDCHVHLYDARCPAVPGTRLTPPDASVADHRRLQQRLGTTRTVLVTPSTYGTDNRCLLDGLQALGDTARGVAVVRGDESEAEWQRLHDAGVRGVRLNYSLGAGMDPAALPALAQRLAAWGWHLQLLMAPDLLATLAPVFDALPVDLVFDHFGRIPPALATPEARHPAHAWLLERLRTGRAWVKLSGGYLVSATHSVSDPALDALARSYLDAAPTRVVWGSDWPHATASAGQHALPDDAAQLDHLAHWCRDDATWRRVLVDNPAALYGFTP